MSENVAPNTDPQPPEVSESNEKAADKSLECNTSNNIEDLTVPALGDQSASTEPSEIPLIKNETATETNTESVAQNIDASCVEVKNEIAETPENAKIQESPLVETPEESLKAAKIEELQSMGAGDTCSRKTEDTTASTTNEISVTSEDPNELNVCTSQREKTAAANSAETDDNEQTISNLQSAMKHISEERDSYKQKLQATEEKLASLQTSYDGLLKDGGDEVMLRRMMEQLKGKLIQTSLQLEDRIRVVANQEKQISALNNQVASLKEVEALTRSLLQIRNMEVKHLQAEVDDMEVRITQERERYNTMINKMDAAVKLNADLKKEYETQLSLFRDLREKYEEKVTLLSEEKRALETAAQSVSK